MAKKKKSVAKTTTKKKVAKKKIAKKKTSKAKSGTKSAPANSVDGILKKFEKERATQENSRSTLRKKIEDLETKLVAMQEQIEKLSAQESSTIEAIAQLDSRRDAEVSELLAKLGVQFAAPAPATETTDDSNASEESAPESDSGSSDTEDETTSGPDDGDSSNNDDNGSDS